MGNLTIRNLTLTPLELKEVERINTTATTHNVCKPKGFAKITSRITGRKAKHVEPTMSAAALNQSSSSSTQQEAISDTMITPFSETATPIAAPAPEAAEELRLTFEEPGTSHRYTASIPGPSPRSIVMKPSSPSSSSSDDQTTPQKEFSLIYLPARSFLSIFSSAQLHAWMSKLPSSYLLSSLSIPGTHNSPTFHVALPSVRCQAVAVREQLDNGVRFLDIRVSCSPPPSGISLNCTDCPDDEVTTDLPLVHSAFPVALSGTKYLHDFLAEVYAFLDANPGEAVLVSLKREGTGRGTDQDLSRYLASRYFGLSSSSALNEETQQNRKRWYTNPAIPTLGAVRGKCVLVRRFHLDEALRPEWHGGAGLGIDGSAWPDNVADGLCGSGLIRIQDYYEVGQTDDIATKIRYVQEELSRAAQQIHIGGDVVQTGQGEGDGKDSDGDPLPLFINFLSGSNFFNAKCWPENIARKINPAIIEHLCADHGAPGKGPGELAVGDASTGIVVTDWVGHDGDWDLIRCIVGWNARLQLKQ